MRATGVLLEAVPTNVAAERVGVATNPPRRDPPAVTASPDAVAEAEEALGHAVIAAEAAAADGEIVVRLARTELRRPAERQYLPLQRLVESRRRTLPPSASKRDRFQGTEELWEVPEGASWPFAEWRSPCTKV